MPRFNDLKGAKDNVYKELSKIFRAGALSVFGAVIEQSPVGNRELWKVNKNRGKRKLQPKGYIGGSFRGNWQASVNAPKRDIIPAKKAARRKEKVESTIKSTVTLKDTLYLTNNLPYAQRLEEGWSTQRPTGWIRTIVASGESALKKAAAQFQGGI